MRNLANMKMNGSVNSESALAGPAGVTGRAPLTEGEMTMGEMRMGEMTKGESALLLTALFTLAASLASFVTL